MPRAIASPREKLITLFEELPTAEALLVYEVLGILLKRRTAEKAGRMVKMRVAPAVTAQAVHVAHVAPSASSHVQPTAGVAGAPPKAKRVRPSRAKAKLVVPTAVTDTVPEPMAQGDGDPGLGPDSYDDGTPEPVGQ